MFGPRWNKVFRDLISNKSRTILVTAAIAVGVFAFGSVFVTQEVLLKNIDLQYRESKATPIKMYVSDFDENLLRWIVTFPGVQEVQGKSVHTLKLTLPDEKQENIQISTVPDWEKLRLNLLVLEKGMWPPGKGEVVLERSGATAIKAAIGDTLKIETNLGRDYELIYTGTVYDNSAFPYIFSRQITGYISWETLGQLDYPKKLNQLEISTGPEITTLEEAEKLTDGLSEKLQDRGMTVSGNMVLKPNQHWATDNSKAFTAILSIIGVFSLVLSGFLVVNTISALLAAQKKQVGIMKAIGASRRQIIALYLVTVGFYGLLALAVAIPVGMGLGYVFLKLVTDFLNLNIKVFYLPPIVLVLEASAALVVPIVSAAIPVISGTRKSVREAISDYQSTTKAGKFDQALVRIKGLPLTLQISLRNIFRKKSRLVMTLGTLVVAGGLFMSVINVQEGMYLEMDRILSMFDFQVRINLAKDADTEGLLKRLAEIEKVTEVEARTGFLAKRIKTDGSRGAQFPVSGVPPETVFSQPVMLSGRWLKKSDQEKLVISSALSRDNPDLIPGEIIEFEANDDQFSLEIVGIVAMSDKLAFTDFGTASRIKDKPGMATQYLLKTNPEDEKTQEEVGEEAQLRLERAGLTVANRQTKADIYASAANQFNFLIFFLLTMAIMVAGVGGLGLAGTMSLNVMERTREIGIMRSVGAGDKTIRKLVVTEGLMVGVFSWLVAVPLSWPLTYGFCYMVGNAFFERTLVFAVVPRGIFIWLGIVVVISIAASLIPAARASKMSVRETLSYE